MARKVRKKLGEILIGDGILGEDVIVASEASAQASGKRLGEVLVEDGHATEVQVASALARQAGMDFVDLGTAEGSAMVDLSLVGDDIVRKHCVIPLSNPDGSRLRLLVHDPMDLEMLDLLRFRLPEEFDLVVGVKSQMLDWIGEGGSAKLTGEAGPDSIDVTVDKSVDSSVDSSIDSSIDVDAGDSKIVRLVNELIVEAVRGRASDIHVEPREDRVELRYRVDGVCHVRQSLPKRNQSAILARLKLMAGVNISERRIPPGRSNQIAHRW